tara:strand:+ start:993 stop:1160 length:168 start_codon:yes stop_codon:yes gene_type:complete
MALLCGKKAVGLVHHQKTWNFFLDPTPVKVAKILRGLLKPREPLKIGNFCGVGQI